MIASESQWDPSARSNTGDVGLVQINLASHPTITEKEALNADFSLRWAAKWFKEGKEWQLWTVCSCVKQIKAQGIKVPKGWSSCDFRPNTTPFVGAVAVYRYGDGTSGITWHVAEVTALGDTGFTERGANIEPCKTYTRDVAWDDPNLIGFWKPDTSPTSLDGVD